MMSGVGWTRNPPRSGQSHWSAPNPLMESLLDQRRARKVSARRRLRHGWLAQWSEHRVYNPVVGGSTPSPASMSQNHDNSRQWRETHPSSREHKAMRRRYVDAYKAARGCVDCGEKDPRCLDLDHKPGVIKVMSKVMSVANMVSTGQSLATVQAELEKCEVRCANCHLRSPSSGSMTRIRNSFWVRSSVVEQQD